MKPSRDASSPSKVSARIEQSLSRALDPLDGPDVPPRLAAAIRHAVFPGGGRLRPRLTLTVAAACGDPAPRIAEAAGVAIELLHCASLVHDDLPCFDDAPTRRGRPSVHRAHGEQLATLAGDALIVMAFAVIAEGATDHPARGLALTSAIARGVGPSSGIIAGQAWESEPRASRERYQRAKTAALFEAAVVCGAIAAGADPQVWRRFGLRLGEAYQVADDLADVHGDSAWLGKPVGVDAARGRPNASRELGHHGAERLLERLIQEAGDELPPCADPADLRALLVRTASRLIGASAAE